MARYEHLPILRKILGQVYKKATDLTIYLEKIVRNFSRYHKYTLGSELRERKAEKLPLLLELRERLEALQVLLRISKEVRAFNGFNSYAHAAKLAVELSRQNGGWINSQPET